MNDCPQYIRETTFLRRFGWLISTLGFLVGVFLAGGLWAAITIDSVHFPDELSDWFSGKGILLGLACASLPLVWWLGLQVERKWGITLRRYGVAAWVAILLVLCVELVVRSYSTQEMLWQAVRSRAGALNYFAREVALVRLADINYQRMPPDSAGVVVVGSSQMLHALNVNSLADETGLIVHRRATAGMFPLEMLAWQPFPEHKDGHIILMMISGFDLGGRDRFYANLVKPLVTPDGLSEITKIASRSFLFNHWREWTDLWVSSRVELWRSRDYIRYLLEHPFSVEKVSTGSMMDRVTLDRQRDGYLDLGASEDMVRFVETALMRLWECLSDRYRTVIVLEGSVNPDYADDTSYIVLSYRARQLAEAASNRGLILYWPRSKQHLDLPREVWLDNVHVNDAGQQLYTREFVHMIKHAMETGVNQP